MKVFTPDLIWTFKKINISTKVIFEFELVLRGLVIGISSIVGLGLIRRHHYCNKACFEMAKATKQTVNDASDRYISNNGEKGFNS